MPVYYAYVSFIRSSRGVVLLAPRWRDVHGRSDATDADSVPLRFDTGHVASGGDSLDRIRRCAGRIGFVHIEQRGPEALRQVNDEGLGFREAVRRGPRVEPLAGVPSQADIVTEFAKLDAERLVIVEQGLYPTDHGRRTAS